EDRRDERTDGSKTHKQPRTTGMWASVTMERARCQPARRRLHPSASLRFPPARVGAGAVDPRGCPAAVERAGLEAAPGAASLPGSHHGPRRGPLRAVKGLALRASEPGGVPLWWILGPANSHLPPAASAARRSPGG